ncbi:EPIDERMAL PATTERNING FACTOR-like protein 6 [Magnolia sinica]|uniref:EPIDERMAL PATTERNING FACTOR-like protein 6 n=1 Tax=Magnolia sinica TaxID=86752 RepID=UPI00265B1D6C|nr:EPIDERMAL PATTERNING FACTOR-like protein 6 [Magnolia sinica]
MRMWAEQKKSVFWPLLITILQIMSWVSAASRLFPREVEVQAPSSMQSGWESKQGFKSKEMEGGLHEEAFEALGTLGSKPPSCDNKCGGCSPCEATQVPTTTDHLGIQYSNYEPEGWKCKCGPSFYNP